MAMTGRPRIFWLMARRRALVVFSAQNLRKSKAKEEKSMSILAGKKVIIIGDRDGIPGMGTWGIRAAQGTQPSP